MTGRIVPFRPLVGDDRHGTVHVMPHENGGYEVAHESASGDSWGSFSGMIPDAQAAVAAAHSLNRNSYGGRRAVSVCGEALGACRC